MTKLNPIIYRKLMAQAEEAKEQGLTKLANSIAEAIAEEPEEQLKEYSYAQLQDDVHKQLWKAATLMMKYYDLDSTDVQKLDKNITVWASEMLDEMEQTLGVDSMIKGPLEPKLPGEKQIT
jgi:hypothetical protein